MVKTKNDDNMLRASIYGFHIAVICRKLDPVSSPERLCHKRLATVLCLGQIFNAGCMRGIITCRYERIARDFVLIYSLMYQITTYKTARHVPNGRDMSSSLILYLPARNGG